MSDGALEIDGVRLAFTRRGKGNPLVLLHGYPLNRTIWSGVAGILEGEFDLIMPDLRGFGESDVMEADRSTMTYAADLAGMMRRLSIRETHVVGHSMGGYVALAFARLFGAMLSGLGLVASQVSADSEDRKAARQAAARQVVREGVSSVLETMPPRLSADPEVQGLTRRLITQQRPLGLAVALDAMAGRPDSTDVLRSLGSPVVLVHGTADELIPVERAREMRRLLPAAHYLELEGVGHMPMIERPAAVAQALRFFAGVR